MWIYLNSRSHHVCTVLKHSISLAYIPLFHIRNYNLELENWLSVDSQRGTETSGISILLLIDISLTL